MSMEDLYKKIIALAIWAPSGDNCQPWRFVIKKNALLVYNIPERDVSLYSWGQRASIIALGALLQNIIITAQQFGYRAHVQTFPSEQETELVYSITLEQHEEAPPELFEYITKRTSNRKPYQGTPLTIQEKQALMQAHGTISTARMILVEDTLSTKVLGGIGGANEQVLLDNQYMHSFFFNHINWTKEEDAEKSIGFYIETLELPPPAKFLFRYIRNWNVMKKFNLLGFNKLVAKGNAAIYNSAPAFGAIIIPTIEKDDFLAAGQLLQNTWLTASKLNLYLQPLTGVLFLKLNVEFGNTKNLNADHITLVKNNYVHIKQIFQAKENERVAMLFRIGHADAPTAKSSRLQPNILTL